jgi:hypothetical protein
MATKNDMETHRKALALIQANRMDDEPGIVAVLGMVREAEIGEFLVAITELVSVAFDTDPATGWDAFISHHAANIDAAESDPERR